MFFKPKNYLAVALWLAIASCNPNYQLVKSNRVAYSINKEVQNDSAVIKTYLPYKIRLDAEMSRVIGHAEVSLTARSAVPESLLGNFFADAVWHQSRKIVPEVDLVFPTTKGGLRNEIAGGDITVSSIFELMPFENQLVLFELKGSDVYNVIKYIAATNGQPVAGLRMNIAENKTPENIQINGKPFNPDKNYLVITSDYIASGGDDAQGFTNPISRKNIGLLVRDALLNEVAEVQASGKKISAKLDGRITKN